MRRKVIANVTVGRAQVRPSASSHTPGVREGNRRFMLARDPGIRRRGLEARATARRSTGVNAKAHEPIDPRMPNLSPP
jgi:hypothetical protein